jgi:hypothetical protein
MDMIETVLIVVVAFWLGNRWATNFHQKIFREILKELGVTEQQLKDLMQRQQRQLAGLTIEESTADLTVVEVRLEQQGNQIYAYRKDDSTFLGQGHDRDSLIERLTQNLTPCRVVIDLEDGGDLLQKNNT